MSGATIRVSVQSGDFDAAAESATLARAVGVGAIVSFTGLCRNEGGTLSALEIEHFPGMAEAEITRIAEEAARRWAVRGLTILHRFGRLAAGEQIVLVLASAVHRAEAFGAAGFIMDYLKTDAPFWKKEHRVDGSIGDWVAPKASDTAAAARWRQK